MLRFNIGIIDRHLSIGYLFICSENCYKLRLIAALVTFAAARVMVAVKVIVEVLVVQ